MKIKYVQLESEAFLTDLDFIAMTLEERGAYWTLILYLYCNKGKCELDISVPSRLCNRIVWTSQSDLLFIQRPGNTAHIPLGWVFAFNS
jgi:hypothetical protein